MGLPSSLAQLYVTVQFLLNSLRASAAHANKSTGGRFHKIPEPVDPVGNPVLTFYNVLPMSSHTCYPCPQSIHLSRAHVYIRMHVVTLALEDARRVLLDVGYLFAASTMEFRQLE